MRSNRRLAPAALAGLLLLLLGPAGPAGAQRSDGPDLARMHVETVAAAERAVVGITATARARRASYYGTGALVSADGYVLTSITVVPGDCDEIFVILEGGRRLEARLIGTVDPLELSLVKIEGKDLPYLEIGRSSDLSLGQSIYTFGNCFHSIELDDRASLSTGIVSGFYELDEKRSESLYTGPVIEITAALNPGVDGGPLVDARGRLIGLLCLNYSPNRWLGVAIPIDALAPHLAKMMGKTHDRPADASPIPTRNSISDEALAAAAAGVVALEVDRIQDIEPPRRQGNPLGGPGDPEAQEYQRRPDGSVTGLVIGADGWILTSYYNVAGELRSITAHLPGGRTAPAEVVGWDESKDVALLKVEATGLPEPRWAEDHEAATGDLVYVMGRSPDPARLTLTQGIISATGRMWGDCIQLDAKLNYGSTGGPVVTRDGEILGIACHISNTTDWGQSSGIGFAATWTKIRGVLDRMKAGEKIERPPQPFLGVGFDMDPTIQGARISRVVPDSAAAEAGVLAGDIVIEINGVAIKDPTDLGREIRKGSVGTKIHLKARRGDEIVDLTATLRARPAGE